MARKSRTHSDSRASDPKEEEGLLDIEEAPFKTNYSDEEIWHVITTETNQEPIP